MNIVQLRDQSAAAGLLIDGSVELIHTPGHTPGSVTVTLTHDPGVLWFTGDRARVRRLHAALTGLDLFPSHDPRTAARLRSLDETRSA